MTASTAVRAELETDAGLVHRYQSVDSLLQNPIIPVIKTYSFLYLLRRLPF